jgi:hypothetical protein
LMHVGLHFFYDQFLVLLSLTVAHLAYEHRPGLLTLKDTQCGLVRGLLRGKTQIYRLYSFTGVHFFSFIDLYALARTKPIIAAKNRGQV